MTTRLDSPRATLTFRILAIGWTLVILALCSIPGQELPEIRIVSIDKFGHFAMFAGFGWLWMHALSTPVPTRFRRVVAAGLAYAVLTELYQGILPLGREPDPFDALANGAGLLAGALLWRFRIHGTGRSRPG